MDQPQPTWLVMIRDVSETIQVRGEPSLLACLVLDVDTGLVRGVAVADLARTACSQAMQAALTAPAGPLPPGQPVEVRCTGVPATQVHEELAALLQTGTVPRVVDSEPVAEAEDILDSLVGHLSGRGQPEDPPSPADWRLLYELAGEYRQAEPWVRRSDAEHLDVVVRVSGAAARYVAVVLGQEMVQRGLALYPGAVLPPDLYDWEAGDPVPLPEGTLLLWLDPPDEVPTDFLAKAARYGWRRGDDLAPIVLTGGPGGPADLDRRAAYHLALTIAAVLDHDGPDRSPGNGTTALAGELQLPDGSRGGYTVGEVPH